MIALQAEIRRALPGEAATLSAIALRSKALWGYDAAFMEACRAPLTVDPEAIAKCPFYVLDEGGTITGFYGLRASLLGEKSSFCSSRRRGFAVVAGSNWYGILGIGPKPGVRGDGRFG